ATQPFAVVARDVASGDERVVYPHGVNEVVLSPDGQSLAFVTGFRTEDPTAGAKRTIRVMPSNGGPYKEIYTFDSNAASVPLAWTAEGKFLLFTTSTPAADELWRLSVDGGPPEKVGVSLPNITSLSLHPDGRQLAISSGIAAREIWMMQNLGSSS